MTSWEQQPPDESALIKTIQEHYGLDVSEEERRIFADWLTSQASSLEQPIRLERTEQALEYLPAAPNPEEKGVEVYFEVAHSADDLHEVLDRWREGNPAFEIALHAYTDHVFSVEVGTKMGGTAPHDGARYIGHYHPMIAYENPDVLPEAFVKGVMPSSGDIKGFLKHPAAVRGGTRIVSAGGCAVVSLIEESDPPALDETTEEKIAIFKAKYLNLFKGENSLDARSNEDVAQLLTKFGLHIEFQMESHEISNPSASATS